MSPNEVEITQRMPKSISAQGACSRDRAAAEIVAGDQDLGFAIGRLVEHEVGVLAAVVLVAHLGEQAFAEPGALDGLQILLGDDHVGVDIDDPQRRGDAFQRGEFVHGGSSSWEPASSCALSRRPMRRRSMLQADQRDLRIAVELTAVISWRRVPRA